MEDNVYEDQDTVSTVETYTVDYPLENELYLYLENVYKDNTVRWVNIFQHLNGLNQIRHNKNIIFLEKIEERLIEIIKRTEDETSTPDELEIYMKRSIQNYLEFYNITIDITKCTFYQLEDFLSAYITIFNVDLPSTEDLLEQLGDETIDPIERFTSIVSQYATYRESEIFDMIGNVSEEWFDYIRSYFRAKLHRGVEEINNDDILAIKPLLLVDKRFVTTYVVQDLLYYGQAIFNFDTYLDKLYDNIDSYATDVEPIALEIAAVNFLSADKPIKDLSTLTTYINFRALTNFTYKDALDILAPKVLEYIEAIKG